MACVTPRSINLRRRIFRYPSKMMLSQSEVFGDAINVLLLSGLDPRII